MTEADKVIQEVCARDNPRIGSGIWRCMKCGERCKEHQIGHQKSWGGDHDNWGMAGSPAEYVDICPACGSAESMMELSIEELDAEEMAKEVLMVEPTKPRDCGHRVARGILHGKMKSE